MIRRPPRSTQSRSSAASDVYKRQGLSRDSPDSCLVCRHDRTAEFTSNPDSLMHQGSHFVKAKACHDSSSVLVFAGDTERGPVEHLVGTSTGSRESVEQKLSTHVPVHRQLGKVVDGISYSDENVQIVQSEVCQTVRQVEAADTCEHSSSQCSGKVEQLSQVSKPVSYTHLTLPTIYSV